ncbi:hypothetical protein HNR63_000045 [Anoxybacillus kamchatkensis]|uniref:hypothetical protein n=1 Tax=Anoxybacillus ayderensis TaxID=265546 RepID=UPI0015EB81F4|nr:hypothetical protein [Anoxybacillus ayderensis]MBA2877018.1 hypothetical protein [Anoxybacillus ayderensis]
MILKDIYYLSNQLVNEALEYAELSKRYTSNRHDFHEGGLSNKKQKMYEGKLGEKIFKTFLLENRIKFEEDKSRYDEADLFDFILPDGTTIDVKTRTKPFHIRTLELVEQFQKNAKDIYVSVRLFDNLRSGKILGWVSKEDILRINRIENHGYLDNYTIYDNELRSMTELWDLYLNKHIQN